MFVYLCICMCVDITRMCRTMYVIVCTSTCIRTYAYMSMHACLLRMFEYV